MAKNDLLVIIRIVANIFLFIAPFVGTYVMKYIPTLLEGPVFWGGLLGSIAICIFVPYFQSLSGKLKLYRRGLAGLGIFALVWTMFWLVRHMPPLWNMYISYIPWILLLFGTIGEMVLMRED